MDKITLTNKQTGETVTGTILKHVATISRWANGAYELNMVLWDKPLSRPDERISYDFRFWNEDGTFRAGQQFSKYELKNFAKAYESIKDMSFDI